MGGIGQIGGIPPYMGNIMPMGSSENGLEQQMQEMQIGGGFGMTGFGGSGMEGMSDMGGLVEGVGGGLGDKGGQGGVQQGMMGTGMGIGGMGMGRMGFGGMGGMGMGMGLAPFYQGQGEQRPLPLLSSHFASIPPLGLFNSREPVSDHYHQTEL